MLKYLKSDFKFFKILGVTHVKKVVLSMLMLAGVSAFAASQSSGPINNQKELNKPTVGGRQSGSEQIFGNQPVTGQNGQKYNTSGVTKSKNKSTVGGRQSGSEQIFGNP